MVGIQLAVLWGIPARLLHPDPQDAFLHCPLQQQSWAWKVEPSPTRRRPASQGTGSCWNGNELLT